MNVTLFNQDGEEIDTDALAKMSLIEERKVNSSIRSAMAPRDNGEGSDGPNFDEPAVTVAEDLAAEEGLSVGFNPSGLNSDD